MDYKVYEDFCFKEYGDRVLYWTTMNEKNLFVLGGSDMGSTPQGIAPLLLELDLALEATLQPNHK